MGIDVPGSPYQLAASTNLIDAFADTVALYPHRPAIVHNGDSLTYAGLADLVRSVARALGPAPGTVAVLTDRSPGTVIGLLGVLAAGGTYCPIDPSFPAPRRDSMLAAAHCRTVLASGPIPPVPADVEVLSLTDLGPDPRPFSVLGSDEPAYVLFTSGSTGEPKPVMTPRGAIAITVGALRVLFDLTPADRVLQFASLSWDTCFEEILPTLTAGASLVFDDEAYTGSFPRFLRMLEQQSVTVLDLPTAYWHELVRYLVEEQASLPPSLRLMVIGGEGASPARLADWRRLDTGRIRLTNTYGCTETTLITHAIDLNGDGHSRIPIGLALPHVQERITDTGELLVGGPALALGYLGRPEDTGRRFLEFDDGRFFRTGDRVSRTADGLLLHEGRMDHEIKVRGIRVDPAEIEAHLVQHPSVVAAAVAGVTQADRTALVGYVVAKSTDDLLAWLRERVPAHLVPSRITFVPELVRTASGKTDRAGTHRRYAPKEGHDDR